MLLNILIPLIGVVADQLVKYWASTALREAIAAEEERLAGAGRILVRPSGTEALIRVMVEAKTQSEAEETAGKLVNFIKSLKF